MAFNAKSISGCADKLSDRKLKLYNIKSRKYNYASKKADKFSVRKEEHFKRTISRKQDRKYKEALQQFTEKFIGEFDFDYYAEMNDDVSYYDCFFDDDDSSTLSDATTEPYSLPNYDSDEDDHMDF